MEEYRKKALYILDLQFKMIEFSKEIIMKRNKVESLYGVINFLYTTDVLTYDEWLFLSKVLNEYKVLIENERS